ncbi:hypothetical protein V6N13_138532 [Hibiscus sabdariffa]
MAKLPIQFLACSFFLVLALHSFSVRCQEVEDETEFSYSADSPIGPARWGEIHADWGACSNGTMQSPIDMSSERVSIVSHLGRLRRSYKPTNAVLRNRGHDMMLRWEGEAGAIEINGTEYALSQCHWHSPSEHTINGRRYDLELHLVHESADGKVAVVGIMYKIGRPDSFLSSVRTVTREQLRLLRVAVHDDSDTNARPLQAINDRSIELFRPDDKGQN